MCMASGAPLLRQLIVAGKTPRVLPAHGDDELPDMCLCYAEHQWESGDSFVEFMRFVDQRVNPSGAPHPMGTHTKLGQALAVPCR